MTEDVENLILRQLRAIDTKLDRVIADVGDVKVRVTALEEGYAGVHRRLDRIEQRLDRIERRLELTDA